MHCFALIPTKSVFAFRIQSMPKTVWPDKYFQPCYRPQRSWGKVMILHLSVILFTGGGVCHTHFPLGKHPPPGRHPLCSTCWDMVNKRVVRILLECNLVTGCNEVVAKAGSTPPWEGGTPQEGSTPLGRKHPPGRKHPLPRHTVNERPVRILLECNLVIKIILRFYLFFWSFFRLINFLILIGL